MATRIALSIALLALLLSCGSIYLAFTLSGPTIVLDPNAPSTAPLTAPGNIPAEQAEVCRDILMVTDTAGGSVARQKQQLILTAWKSAKCGEYFERVGSHGVPPAGPPAGVAP